MTAPDPRDLIRNDQYALGAGIIRRPVIPGDPDSGLLPHPEPMAGIRTAVALRNETGRVIRDCARYAREDGKTWQDIADALGCKPDPYGTSAGEAAFRTVASDLGSGLSFAWTCPSCGQVVTDRGPEMGHPEDTETGHGGGCERFTAEIAAWDARWDGE